MALGNRSLFLYGYQVSVTNASIDFKNAGGGPEIQATLNFGYYSLTGLLAEIKRAMQAADPANTYNATASRTLSGGLENRVTIVTTTGSFLSLLFSSGTRAASSIATTIGFTSTDKTGALTYTGSSSTGTTLLPEQRGYNWLSPNFKHKVFGTLNISASGVKEAVVFNIQRFFQVQFKYEPNGPAISPTNLKVDTQWVTLMDWLIQQRPLEFTPDISLPNTFYQGTLEQSSLDYNFKEMLPDHPNFYDTGLLTFRQIV